MASKKSGLWMEAAKRRMKAKGTVGSFGKATPGKIARAKKEGGAEEKKAIFAENAAKASRHHAAIAHHHRKLAEIHDELAKQ